MIRASDIRDFAARVGLHDVGWAKADYLSEAAPYLQQWLQEGKQGSMGYMARNLEKRLDPRLLVPGTRTIVVGALSYYKDCHQPVGAPYIALSGISERDYHEVMKEKMQALETLLVEKYGSQVVDPSLQHVFCDSAPVLERPWAVRAGLGFIGLNRQFIHPRLGSFVHLAELFLADEVEPSSPTPESSGCSICLTNTRPRCLQACPTEAITPEGMDARRCVSYLTIERREPLPEEHKGKGYIGLYGCDACQRACPYNKGLTPDLAPELAANPELLRLTRDDWQQTSRRQRLKLLRRLAPDN